MPIFAHPARVGIDRESTSLIYAVFKETAPCQEHLGLIRRTNIGPALVVASRRKLAKTFLESRRGRT
jgi:hypothetical protein